MSSLDRISPLVSITRSEKLLNLSKTIKQFETGQGLGRRQVIDLGNIVHAADAGIVTIAQVQPIAVVFTISEDSLPRVLARLRESASMPVEAWNRDATAKIATGHLMAVDNQIDPATGTVKLKAVFDNKDGALFPNQFVNVRLLGNSQ
jgi:membrane fusion protein, multidrug efflux system